MHFLQWRMRTQPAPCCCRCWTVQLDAGGGSKVAVDLGAGWVHGLTDNPIVQLAQQANVALASQLTDYDKSQLWLWDGTEVSAAQEAA